MTVSKEIRKQVLIDYNNKLRPAYIREKNGIKKTTYYNIIKEKEEVVKEVVFKLPRNSMMDQNGIYEVHYNNNDEGIHKHYMNYDFTPCHKECINEE